MEFFQEDEDISQEDPGSGWMAGRFFPGEGLSIFCGENMINHDKPLISIHF
jgi:hypothetical protein